MINVILKENLKGLIQICVADHSYFESFDKTFLVSLFQLLLFHCSMSQFTVYSQVSNTGKVLMVRGVGIFHYQGVTQKFWIDGIL